MPVRDLGQTLEILLDALNKAPVEPKWASHWFEYSFDLHIVGWQWSKKRYRPVVIGLSKPSKSSVFHMQCLPRYWYLERGPADASGKRTYRFNIAVAPAANMTRAQVRDIISRTCDRTRDDAEKILVEAIREISRVVPEVGSHCISVLLAPPWVARAWVRYIPLQGPAQATLTTTEGIKLHLPVAFCPWLIGPDGIMAPSVLAGSTQVSLGRYLVSIEAPYGETGLLSSLRRPPLPKV